MGDKNITIKCQQPASGIPCVTEGFGIWPEVGGIYLLIFLSFFPVQVFLVVFAHRPSPPPAERPSNITTTTNNNNNNVGGVSSSGIGTIVCGKRAFKRTTTKKKSPEFYKRFVISQACALP